MPRVLISYDFGAGISEGAIKQLSDFINNLTITLRQGRISCLCTPPNLDLKSKITWVKSTGFTFANGDLVINFTLGISQVDELNIWYKNDPSKSSKIFADDLKSRLAKIEDIKVNSQSEDQETIKSELFKSVDLATVIIDLKVSKDENILKFFTNLGKLKFAELISASVRYLFSLTVRPINIPVAKPIQNQFQSYGMSQMPNPQVNMYQSDPNAKTESIKNLYRIVLGRVPTQSDLNYFLNINITDDALIRKMVESLEHAEIVKARQEVITARTQFNFMQTKIQELETQVKDKSQIVNNMNKLVEQKNEIIDEINKKFEESNKKKVKESRRIQPKKPGFIERVLEWFNRVFE